jgi:hypothetical protein
MRTYQVVKTSNGYKVALLTTEHFMRSVDITSIIARCEVNAWDKKHAVARAAAIFKKRNL